VERLLLLTLNENPLKKEQQNPNPVPYPETWQEDCASVAFNTCLEDLDIIFARESKSDHG